MNNYIDQLLELIEHSKKDAPQTNHSTCNGDEDEQLFATQFLHGTPEKISKIVGIEKYNFPSPCKLNNDQINRLLKEIEDLLLRYNLEFMFPENVTDKIKYEFIVDNWNSKHIHCKEGIVQIETCKFDESDCPFPGHCNVCASFKCDHDSTHHLEKGIIDFSSLTPELDEDDDEELRQNVDRFKDLMKQPKSEDYITGIHNYCDGRCKSCQFTNQCSSYAINKELEKLSDNTDNESGADQLKIIFKATTEIIEEELDKRGINVDDAISEIDTLGENKNWVKHDIEKQAESYAEKVTRWLESNQMELESRIVSKPDSDINKYIETITWFQLFIPAKIHRAIKGMSNNEESDISLYDANGSAKVALLAIDECLDAWEYLMELISTKEDSILNMLRHLSKLRNEFEVLMPEARSFIRPGFDE